MLSSISPVYALAPTRQGENLGLRLRCLRVPGPCLAISLAAKFTSKSNMSSSSSSAPPGASSSSIWRNYEEPPPKPVRDWDEGLVVSTEHRLLMQCAMCMPSAGVVSSPPRSKRRWKVRATCMLAEIVSLSLLDKSTRNGTIVGAFPRFLLNLTHRDMICKSKFRFG